MSKKFFVIAMLLGLNCIIAGCQQKNDIDKSSYETVKAAPNRNSDLARLHNAKAVAALKCKDYEKAEKELKAALDADVFYGPAHNNLGNVYFEQKKYYKAAWEFQYAAKLMPNSAQPRNNLGMVFEAVSRSDEAAQWYDKALKLEPESVEVIANLARLRVKNKQYDEKTRQLLAKVVLMDDREEWINWAKERLAILGQPKQSPLPFTPEKTQ